MEWVEMIRLRGNLKEMQKLQEDVVTELNRWQKTPGFLGTLVMFQMPNETDLAIVLVWKNEREPVKTREGLSLTGFLEQFGSVDHSVWRILSNNIVSNSDDKPASPSSVKPAHHGKVAFNQ